MVEAGPRERPLRAPRITPVPTERRETTGGDGLRRVLSGVPPDAAFDDPEEFAAAAERARRGDHEWRPAPDRLTQ